MSRVSTLPSQTGSQRQVTMRPLPIPGAKVDTVAGTGTKSAHFAKFGSSPPEGKISCTIPVHRSFHACLFKYIFPRNSSNRTPRIGTRVSSATLASICDGAVVVRREEM